MSKVLHLNKKSVASLLKVPGLVVTVLLTIGLTVGLLLCTFTLNYLLLVKPLPYKNQDGLVVAKHEWVDSNNINKGDAFTYPGLVFLYKNTAAFSASAMIYYRNGVVHYGASQETLNVAFTTPEFFDLLTVPMVVGREFKNSESYDSHNPVAIISYEMWQQSFNKTPDILEKKLTISGVTYLIVGVTDKKFFEPSLSGEGKTSVWLPWDFNPDNDVVRNSWSNISGPLFLLARLNNSDFMTGTESALTDSLNSRWQKEVVGVDFFKGWNVSIKLVKLKNLITGNSDKVALLLLVAVFGLVIIASINIFTLLVSRIAEQQNQFSIRAVFGAKKRDIYFESVVELGILIGLSTVVAFIVAAIGFELMRTHLDGFMPRIDELSMSPVTILGAIFCALSLIYIFSRFQVGILNYSSLMTTLRRGGKGGGVQISKGIRRALIFFQVFAAITIIFFNIILFIQAYQVFSRPLGFDVSSIYSLRLAPSVSDSMTRDERVSILSVIENDIEKLPQIESISRSMSPVSKYSILAVTEHKTHSHFTPLSIQVDDHFFEMIQLPLLKGRVFTGADISDRNKVIVVNRAFANQIEKSGDAIGGAISLDNGDQFSVVGVVENSASPELSENTPILYLPSGAALPDFLIKFKKGSYLNKVDMANIVRGLDTRFDVFDFSSVSDLQNKIIKPQMATLIVTVLLAIFIFFLSGVGMYGIISYGTYLRRFELGVRMAVGAKARHIVGLVLKDNIHYFVVGSVCSFVVILSLWVLNFDFMRDFYNAYSILIFLITNCVVLFLCILACVLPLLNYIKNLPLALIRSQE